MTSVLIVDDTEQILKLTKEIFEIAGYKVITAVDGEKALEILAETQIDLVVTDILMPNVDGYILCYSIRTNDKLKDIPVIIYSATYTSASDESMAMEIGADKFIRKPAAMETLISTAQQLIGDNQKIMHKFPTKPRSLEASRLYNEGLVQKLEKRNIELEKASELLEVNALRLKEAQAVANLGSWEIDFATNETIWSDGLYNIFGMKKDETPPSAEQFLSVIHPEDFDRVNHNIQLAFSTLEGASFEFRFIRGDGTVRYGFSKYGVEFHKTQKPLRLFGIVQDITDRHTAIEALISRNKDLEQFAYIVSHNLRAPVANILGAVRNINNPTATPEQKALLFQGLYDVTLRLDTVVKDLNQILQLKSDKDKKVSVSFTELLSDIMMALKENITNANAKIQYDFSAIDTFSTLKSYMHSIFYNLISNSLNYKRPEVSTVIEIKSYVTPNKIGLIFKDNGLGIDLQKRGDEVFRLYKRFHSHIEGKGMGLFMVKTQVESLGGSITINSEVNKGTEFKIEFNK